MFFCLEKNSVIRRQLSVSVLAGTASVVLLLLLASCSMSTMKLPSVMPEPPHQNKAADASAAKLAEQQQTRTFSIEEITMPAVSTAQSAQADGQQKPQLDLPGGTLSLNADGMPLNEFVHMALGDVLHLNFDMDKTVASRKDPVTLHISSPVNAARLLGMVDKALSLFDVGMEVQDGVVRVLPLSKLVRHSPSVATAKEKVMLRLGRVMEIIPLNYASYGDFSQLAAYFFARGSGGGLIPLPRQNAVIAVGNAQQIQGVRDAVAVIDRPFAFGMKISIARPVFWQADGLIKQVEKVLKLQGIRVNVPAGMQLLAVEEINAVLMMSPKQQWLDAAVSLMKTLDTADSSDSGKQIFTYFVRYTDAEKLGRVISDVLGQAAPAPAPKAASGSPVAGRAAPVSPPAPASPAPVSPDQKSRIVVDSNRNALIFIGEAADYQKAYRLLKTLDRAPRQVLLEATIADVSLDNSTQLGVEWQFNNVDNSSLTGTLGTLGGLGVGAAGLSYSLVNAAGALRAKINALASVGKAKILSTPTLLAMDGEKARIQVGTQVAVLNSEITDSSSVGGGSTGLLRSFNYIDTGVILEIEPVITEQGAVQLKIHQEVSEAGSTTSDTPPINKRAVDTVLSVQSGQTIVIGGLISHNETENRTQVPFLGDIPILGQLFSNTTVTDRSTEMIILLTPHVIFGPEDADFISQTMQQRTGWLDQQLHAGPKSDAAASQKH